MATGEAALAVANGGVDSIPNSDYEWHDSAAAYLIINGHERQEYYYQPHTYRTSTYCKIWPGNVGELQEKTGKGNFQQRAAPTSFMRSGRHRKLIA